MTNLNNGDDLQPEPPASLPVGLPLSFPFFQLIEYCRECNSWEEANQIFAMINRLMRFVGTQQDYDLLDSVEKILKQRSHGHVFHNSKITMEQPHINGPKFDIHDNQNINFVNQKEFYQPEQPISEDLADMPTSELMAQAVRATIQQGLWWSGRSWAVVYRVYQMKGYVRNCSQFVNEVGNWTVKTGFECTYDAVQKPIASGVYVGHPEKWEQNGAQKQAIKLAFALLAAIEFLMKSTNKDPVGI